MSLLRNKTTITVLGAGSWGTALAMLLARNGCTTRLWGHDATAMTRLQQQRSNERYLPGIKFPEPLQICTSLEQALTGADIALIAVPSFAFKTMLSALQPYVAHLQGVIWATKGLDPESHCLLHEVFSNIIGKQLPFAILSGPSFAGEVALQLPTAITLASSSREFAKQASECLHSKTFRVYPSSDYIGVQIGGAVKNVLAIAAGITDGLSLGVNTRAALITRGLAEMIRLGVALGAQRETLMGLAGLGDLVLTCSDNQSRNRRFGIALGKGIEMSEAKRVINQTIEGAATALEIHQIAQRLNVEMPICEQVYRVIYEKVTPRAAVDNLLSREPKWEFNGGH